METIKTAFLAWFGWNLFPIIIFLVFAIIVLFPIISTIIKNKNRK
jgi:hypothetical protein